MIKGTFLGAPFVSYKGLGWFDLTPEASTTGPIFKPSSVLLDRTTPHIHAPRTAQEPWTRHQFRYVRRALSQAHRVTANWCNAHTHTVVSFGSKVAARPARRNDTLNAQYP